MHAICEEITSLTIGKTAISFLLYKIPTQVDNDMPEVAYIVIHVE